MGKVKAMYGYESGFRYFCELYQEQGITKPGILKILIERKKNNQLCKHYVKGFLAGYKNVTGHSLYN